MSSLFVNIYKYLISCILVTIVFTTKCQWNSFTSQNSSLEMFSICENEVVGFNSDRTIERNVVNDDSQTDPITLIDKTTVTNSTKDIGVQCDAEDIVEKVTLTPSDLEKLNLWLQSVAPLILSELELNETNFFNEYELDSDNEEETEKFSILQTINVDEKSSNKEYSKMKIESESYPISIVSLSWNSVGYTIAAGCGHLYHENWCEHSGNIFVYSKKSNFQNFIPLYETTMNSCVSIVSFHPKESGLLAVTTVSGEILIYDLSYHNENTNKDVFVCSDSSVHSGKGISCLSWFDNKQTNKYLSKTLSATEKILLTGGSDGKLVVWIINLTTSSILKHICYELRSTINKKIKLTSDINCMDFYHLFYSSSNKEENNVHLQISNKRENADDYFVVGCKTGELLLCRTSTARLNESSNYDPFIDNLEPHEGCVLSLSFSSRRPRILLTLGTDQEIKIFDILTNSPLQVIRLDNEFSCVKWTPSNDSSVVGVISKNTNLFPLRIFNIDDKREISLKNFMNEKIEKKYGQCCLEFHSTNSNLLAYGDLSGKITIMEISFKYLM